MKDIRDLITYLSRDKKKTVFLSSHNLYEVELVANRMSIINKGTTQVEGNVSELLNASNLKVNFEVDDVEKAKTLLSTTVWISKAESFSLQNIIFTLEKNEIASVNKFLVENEIKVGAIIPTRSLEQYFLTITEKAVNDKSN